ncbi:MAG: hypothetical protein ACLFP6_10395 [Spirochaetaceae bacterium]
MKRLATLLILFSTVVPLQGQLALPGLYTDHAVGGGISPTALAATSRLWYRIPLAEQRGALWDPAKIDLGVRNQLSPAFEEIGAYFYWEPVAVFDLTVSVAARQTFTLFDAGFYEVAGYDAPYDDLADRGEDRSRSGFRFTVAPRLKAAYARFVALNELRVDVFDFGSNVAEPGERYFYEPVNDTILRFQDTVVANTFLLLYSLTPELLLGGQYYLRSVPDSGAVSHRFSGMAVYSQPLRERLSLFAALLSGSYAGDRYHAGSFYLAGQVGFQAKVWAPRESAPPSEAD